MLACFNMLADLVRVTLLSACQFRAVIAKLRSQFRQMVFFSFTVFLLTSLIRPMYWHAIFHVFTGYVFPRGMKIPRSISRGSPWKNSRSFSHGIPRGMKPRPLFCRIAFIYATAWRDSVLARVCLSAG